VWELYPAAYAVGHLERDMADRLLLVLSLELAADRPKM